MSKNRKGLFTFVDLFSGAGGMSFGFKSHPAFTPIFAVDAQVGKPSSGYGSLGCNSTYEKNIGIKVREANLAEYSPQELLVDSGLKKGQLDVLISCAPCTGFSRTLGKNHVDDDPRNNLVERTGLFVEHIMPKILMMENARELVMGRFSYHCENLKRHLKSLGYSFYADFHMLNEFGLPQIRERAIVIAVRDGGDIKTLEDLWDGFEVAKECVTVREAISDLPPIEAGTKHESDPLHISPSFSNPQSFERIRAIPHNGGSWSDLLTSKKGLSLLTPAMRRLAEKKDFGSHPDVYGRLWWDKPSVTIKRECAHVGNGRYSHPEQDRLCSVREMAILNGFTRDYNFNGTSMSNKYRQIGDAVPPIISYQLAHIAAWILTEEKPDIHDCVLENTSLSSSAIKPKKEIQRRLF